jgi:hypothetical protein
MKIGQERLVDGWSFVCSLHKMEILSRIFRQRDFLSPEGATYGIAISAFVTKDEA